MTDPGPRLDRLPVGRFHRRIIWLIGAGMFFDSFDVYLAAGVLGALVHSGWSTLGHNATFVSITSVGMLLGALAAGYLGDVKGRKFSYQFNLAIFGLASLAGAVAPSMEWLIVCRFFMGLGLGAEIVIGYGCLGEFVPPQVRGKWSAYLSLIANSALFFSTLLGFLIIPHLGWRVMFVIVGVGAFVIWFRRRAMPESPRWLKSQGRDAEAEAVMAGIEREFAPAQLPDPPDPAAVDDRPARKLGSVDLFKPPYLRRTAIAVCVHVVLNIVIYGFVVWVPTFLVGQGLGVSSSLGYSALMSLGGPAGALIAALISDRVGRRYGILVFSLLAAVTGWAYLSSPNIYLATFLGFIMFTLVYLLVAFGIATHVPELFPTDVRLRGNGVANTTGRIAAIAAPRSSSASTARAESTRSWP
ncbi:MFS transporter [Tsukamurella soli]|uniref:MFS transporter n=1 Tax=Tsukamurella soli TaxID=644556 RepID=UPI003618B801